MLQRTSVLLLVACGTNPPGGPHVDAIAAIDAPVSIDASAVTDPAGDGPYAVTSEAATIPGAATGRSLPSTVFQPVGAPTPAALVVISPGFQMARTQYTSYAHHLATWGFVAISTDYADQSFFPSHQALADDLRAVLDWAVARPELGVDATRMATAGHSLGGKISVLAAADDARIIAVVAWDPVDANAPSVAPERMSDVAGAVAVIGETTNASGGGMPCAPAADNFQAFYAAAAAPALQMTMLGADHMDWVDDPSCGFCGFCSPGGDPAEITRAATRRLDVAWFRRHLFADAAMDPWLSSPPEVAAGHAEVVQK